MKTREKRQNAKGKSEKKIQNDNKDNRRIKEKGYNVKEKFN